MIKSIFGHKLPDIVKTPGDEWGDNNHISFYFFDNKYRIRDSFQDSLMNPSSIFDDLFTIGYYPEELYKYLYNFTGLEREKERNPDFNVSEGYVFKADKYLAAINNPIIFNFIRLRYLLEVLMYFSLPSEGIKSKLGRIYFIIGKCLLYKKINDKEPTNKIGLIIVSTLAKIERIYKGKVQKIS